MHTSWKDSIFQQREELARRLRTPLAQLAELCAPAWGSREQLNTILANEFANIPYCKYLYILGADKIQISDNLSQEGVVTGHYGRDRSQRPYMLEAVPSWGFLLSDAYISLYAHRPSLTAIQIIQADAPLGYLGADFDLRNLPVTSELYEEPKNWRQVKGDPAIRGTLFQQSRVESPMDRNLTRALSILEELITERGVFQCQINFSSSQAMIWVMLDPYRYRMLDHEALTDPDICLDYPGLPYPDNALIPQTEFPRILETMRMLRMADETIYLRTASINVFNGMISMTFSCDGSHYMRYDELLEKDIIFWFGSVT
jgi:hypothetical protein